MRLSFNGNFVSLFRAAATLWLGLVLISVHSSQAQTSLPLSAQGRVTVDGLAFNGTGRFKFALVVSTGRTLLWNNDGTVGSANFEPNAYVALNVTHGLYSVLLGDTNISGMTQVIPHAIFQNSDVRLRVWFNDGTHGFQLLAPDQRLAAVGYAMTAQKAAEAAVFTGNVTINQLPANLVTNNATQVNLTGTFDGDGSGLTGIRGSTPWQIATAGTNFALPNTGYLVTNKAEVTVVLSAQRVGDIIRVAGPNPGAWRILGPVLASHFKPGAGLKFVSRDSARLWSGVASSADGSKLVAVLRTTAAPAIYLSTNSGTTWATPPVTPQKNFHAVASSADGSRLIAAAEGDQLFLSSDSGQSWSPRSVKVFWSGVAASENGTNIIAVAQTAGGTPGPVYTSADGGEVWTLRSGAGSRVWTGVAMAADASRMVAAAAGDRLLVSVDRGVTWADFNSPIATWMGVASSADGLSLAAAPFNAPIVTSSNGGTNWIAHPSSGSFAWTAIACSADGNKIMAAVDNGAIYISMDAGNTWRARTAAFNWRGLAANADFSQLIGVAPSAAIQISQAPKILPQTTTDGYLIGDEGSAVELQFVGGPGSGVFMPLSSQGTIFAY